MDPSRDWGRGNSQWFFGPNAKVKAEKSAQPSPGPTSRLTPARGRCVLGRGAAGVPRPQCPHAWAGRRTRSARSESEGPQQSPETGEGVMRPP